MKRTPGYMIGPSNGTSSVANGTTRPMVMSLRMLDVFTHLSVAMLRVARRRASALDQHRSGALRPLAFVHDAEALGDFGIGFEQPAEVAAEAVLVELLVRLDVPQPAGVRRDFVGDDDAHQVVLPQPAGFHLEVDEADADAEEQAGEEIVDADGERHDVVDLLRRRPAERGDVLFRHQGVVELIVLVIELEDRARQLRAFLDAEPLRQRARRDIAHADFQRNDLDLADQLLTHVEPADEMGRHADVVEMLEDVFGDAVVEDALALDHLVLLGIEGGRVVLEMLDQGSRLGTLIEDFRLAFVDAATAAHGSVPWLCKIHGCRGSNYSARSAAAEVGGTTQRCGPSATQKLAEGGADYNRHRPARPAPQRPCLRFGTVALTGHPR